MKVTEKMSKKDTEFKTGMEVLNNISPFYCIEEDFVYILLYNLNSRCLTGNTKLR